MAKECVTHAHERIKKPRAPGPGHAEKIVLPQNTHAHTNTTNVLDFTVELDTLAIVLGK